MIERGLRAHTHPRSQPLGGQKLLGRMVQTLALLAAAFGALLFGQRTRRVFGLDGSSVRRPAGCGPVPPGPQPEGMRRSGAWSVLLRLSRLRGRLGHKCQASWL